MSATKRFYFPEIYAELPVLPACKHIDYTEDMAGVRTCTNCKEVAYPCDDCGNYEQAKDLYPYKYEPGYKLCQGCLDERMEEN